MKKNLKWVAEDDGYYLRYHTGKRVLSQLLEDCPNHYNNILKMRPPTGK